MPADVGQLVCQDGLELGHGEAREGRDRHEDRGPQPADDHRHFDPRRFEQRHGAADAQPLLESLDPRGPGIGERSGMMSYPSPGLDPAAQEPQREDSDPGHPERHDRREHRFEPVGESRFSRGGTAIETDGRHDRRLRDGIVMDRRRRVGHVPSEMGRDGQRDDHDHRGAGGEVTRPGRRTAEDA